jgi:uncharacterized membrane protein YfcA
MLLYSAARQLVFTFLATAIGALGYFLDARGQATLAVISWALAAACLLAVAGSMIGARALKRQLREKR